MSIAAVRGVLIGLVGGIVLSFLLVGPASAEAPVPGTQAINSVGIPEPTPGGDYVHIVGCVPVEGELLADRILFFFDRPVAPMNEPLFTLAPPLAGRFSRAQGKCIEYVITDKRDLYKFYHEIQFSPNLKSADGKPLDPKQQRLLIVGNYFGVTKAWPVQTDEAQAVAGFELATPVELDMLKSHLEVRGSDNATLPFQLEQGASDAYFKAVVSGDAAPKAAKFVLTPGITDKTGLVLLAVAREIPFPRIPPLQLTKADMRVEGTATVINLSFSAPVEGSALKQATTLTDLDGNTPVEFTVDEQQRSISQQLILATIERESPKIRLAVADKLKAVNGMRLASAFQQDLTYNMVALTIEHTWWGGQYGDDAKNGISLHVSLSRAVPLEQVRKHLSISPGIPNMSVDPSYNQGFQIHGEWRSNASYKITLAPGMVDNTGSTTTTPITVDVHTESVEPYVGFTREEYYFPRRSGLALPIQTRNVDKVTVNVARMFPSNIAVAVDNIDADHGTGDYEFTEKWAERLASVNLDVVNQPDRMVETPIQLDSVFPADKKGVFSLEILGKNKSSSTNSTRKLVLWTNIGLLAHWQGKELILFAHDLFSLKPLNLAKATVYSSKNQVLGTANTDENGIVHLKSFDSALGAPRVVVVEWQDDYTFLKLEDRENAERDTPEPAATPRFNRKAYDAFIYADRDLYRPGETVHAHWFVRTNYGDAVADAPLLANVIKPNGSRLTSQPVFLSPMGSGGLDLATEKTYPTGKYTVTLTVPGNNQPLGSYEFSLEDFVPNRIKTAVTLDQTKLLAGQEYSIKVNSQNLFGTPAQDRKAEAVVLLRRDGFKPEAWKTYRFENDSEFTPEPVPCGDGTTDENGDAAFSFNYAAPKDVTSPMKAIVIGRVFELGGRGVAGKAEATLFPSDLCLGIAASRPSTGTGLEVFAAAVKSDETAAPLAKVNITLEKQVWSYYVRRYEGGMSPKWSQSFEPVETREVPLTEGKGSTVFNPGGYGCYRVRVHSPETPQYSTIAFYYWGGDCSIADSARPSLLKVTLDKPQYNVGEEALVRIESPFDGKGLVVVQGEEIQRMLPVDIKDKVGTVRIPITAEQTPNVWLAVTAVHAVKQDKQQVYPYSSFASVNVPVRDPARLLKVEFPGLPQEVKPAGDVTFAVQVTDSQAQPIEAEVTLAAVDEGIHGITNYQNPDPYAWLFRLRSTDINRAHYYDKVAYDFATPPVGGDALLKELSKRLPSVDDNWVKPLALWSGVVKTDAAGKAAVTMTLPEFAGQIRLVAVACTPRAVGAKGDDVYVRRAHMLRTSMPRFLLPGDDTKARAVVYNNTDAPCKAKVTWTFEGGGAGSGSQDLEVPAHKEASCAASLQAGATLGQRTLKWEAVFTDAAGAELERVQETDPIPVRAPASFQSRFDVAALKPGESREFRNTEFVDDERLELELAVSATPLLRLQDALRFLVHYPYGCVEQVTSTMMPTFLMRQSVEILGGEFKDAGQLDTYLQSGIARLFSMQTVSGGFAMWPGGQTPWQYGSVYALHFLTLVKNGRTLALPEQNFAALQAYVRQLATNQNSDAPCDWFLRAYAIYDLVLAGDAKMAESIGSYDTIPMPSHARHLLAAALAYATKDPERVKQYLAKTPATPDNAYSGDTLNSAMRNKAIELLALTQCGLNPELAAQDAAALTEFLEKNRHYYTTQETAFAVTALSGYLAPLVANADSTAATVTGMGKQEALAGKGVCRVSHTGAGATFTVANTGQTEVYVAMTTRGIPLKPVTEAEKGSGLAVSRRFLTSTGDPYAETSFSQSGSYLVDVNITTDRDLENVALADLLPAGLEVENPRLNPDTLPEGKLVNAVSWPKPTKDNEDSGESEGSEDGAQAPEQPQVMASYLDVRDDRVLLAFEHLPRGEHHFYYVVRAVTPGKYQHPSTQVECMYDARVRASSAAGQIEVK